MRRLALVLGLTLFTVLVTLLVTNGFPAPGIISYIFVPMYIAATTIMFWIVTKDKRE